MTLTGQEARASSGPVAEGGAVRLVGAAGARLLAGPPAGRGPERLAAHATRLGPLPDLEPGRLMASLEESGLTGRGGGGFPSARKLLGVRGTGEAPLLVANAAESEPLSAKDATLCRLRPHLVLDGAAAAASVIGAEEVVLYVHRGASASAAALSRALEERAGDGRRWRLVAGPDRYVAGESSAAVSLATGGEARPRPRRVDAAVHRRRAVVHNVETLAHVALIARFGASWWRRGGSSGSPGSRLVTVAGAVERPGLVAEVVGPATVGAALTAAGTHTPPGAVLVGGYAGRWMDGEVAWACPVDPLALAAAGGVIGCGLVAALPDWACPLAEAARLTAYLADASAGQCGPCVFGLADAAEGMARLAAGTARRPTLRRLRRRLEWVTGRGGCHHPDGVAAMVVSALDAFAPDVERHLRGRPCPGRALPVLPVPSEAAEGWR